MSVSMMERRLDLIDRGSSHFVYERNGSIVQLKNAKIWMDDSGKYVPPKSVPKKVLGLQHNCCVII
jgi:hypothetical protein